MKTHTTQGAATLAAALEQYPKTPFLEMACDIALSHHEKYNGRGYPRGLAGDGIPLAARVMALADVYDALTSRRVYKRAYSHERSRKMVVAGAGKHFDSAVVEAFLDQDDQFIAIRAQYADASAAKINPEPAETAVAATV